MASAITKRSISGSEKSVPAKDQQSKRLRCAAIVPSYRHYVAYAHPPGWVHRAPCLPTKTDKPPSACRRKRRHHREESGGQPMTRIALALALSSAAAAQTTTFRDPSGRVTGKA